MITFVCTAVVTVGFTRVEWVDIYLYTKLCLLFIFEKQMLSMLQTPVQHGQLCLVSRAVCIGWIKFALVKTE